MNEFRNESAQFAGNHRYSNHLQTLPNGMNKFWILFDNPIRMNELQKPFPRTGGRGYPQASTAAKASLAAETVCSMS